MVRTRLPWKVQGILAMLLAFAYVIYPADHSASGSTPGSALAAPTEQQAPLRPVRISPETGVVGTSFQVTADGLPAGGTVEWQWLTWDGWYATEPSAETVAYQKRTFTEKRVSLGRSAVDEQGV